MGEWYLADVDADHRLGTLFEQPLGVDANATAGIETAQWPIPHMDYRKYKHVHVTE